MKRKPRLPFRMERTRAKKMAKPENYFARYNNIALCARDVSFSLRPGNHFFCCAHSLSIENHRTHPSPAKNGCTISGPQFPSKFHSVDYQIVLMHILFGQIEFSRHVCACSGKAGSSTADRTKFHLHFNAIHTRTGRMS